MRCFLLAAIVVGMFIGSRWSPNDFTGSPNRLLTNMETETIRAGAFHYCSLPYPDATACTTCYTTIHWESVVVMMGFPPILVNLTAKCAASSISDVCWQASYSASPNPTCDLNDTPCPGMMSFFQGPSCTGAPAANPPFETCGFYSSNTYKVGTPATATGVNCNGLPSVKFTN